MDIRKIVDVLLEEKPPLTKKALDAAYAWIHSGDKSLLKPEIAKQFVPYRLEKPTTLYQGRRKGGRGLGFSSWTKSHAVAEKFAQGGVVISRIFLPEETIVDFQRVQQARGWKDDFIEAEQEVVVDPSKL